MRCFALVTLCVVLLAGSSSSLLRAEAARDKLAPLPVLQSFNVSQFLGRYFEAYSDLTVHGTFERNGVCVFADYGLFSPNNGSISVHNELRLNSAEGEASSIEGHATPDGTGVPGHLTVVLGAQPFPAPYWVVSTGPIVNDKYDYVIVTDSYQLTMWVLVRNIITFYEMYDSVVLPELQQLGFTSFYNSPIKTNQTNCVYPPPSTTFEKEIDMSIFE